MTRLMKNAVVHSERAGIQPRRKARPNIFNNLSLGRRCGGAEAPPFRGPGRRFSSADQRLPVGPKQYSASSVRM